MALLEAAELPGRTDMLCTEGMKVLVDGLEVPVACGKCQKCREVRRRDVTGRAVAESLGGPVGALFFTGTYAPDRRENFREGYDHPHAGKFVYSDFQAFVRSIRDTRVPGTNEKYKLRYMVAGERGTNGTKRCHWHGILWFYNHVPDVNTDGYTFNDAFWPHGIAMWKVVSGSEYGRAAKYVAKYCVKDFDVNGNVVESVFKASKRPLLGGRYFEHWAQLHVDQGLALRQGRKYQIPGQYKGRSRELYDFWMTEAAAKHTVAAYLEAWAAKYGAQSYPPDARMVERFEDAAASVRVELFRDERQLERLRGGELGGGLRRLRDPSAEPPEGYRSYFDKHVLAFKAVAFDGRPVLFWLPDREVWGERLHGQRSSANDPLPDLPGEEPREFRRVADIPDFVPGEALDLSKRRKKPGERERYRARKAQQYHQEMLASRMDRVARAIKRLRDE